MYTVTLDTAYATLVTKQNLLRMVKNMLYFVVLLLIVLVSFGVCQQSIKFPYEVSETQRLE